MIKIVKCLGNYIKQLYDIHLSEMPENLLTLDRAAVSKNGTDFTEVRPIERIRDNLLRERYSGDIWLRFRFNSEILPETLDFINETQVVKQSMPVFIITLGGMVFTVLAVVLCFFGAMSLGAVLAAIIFSILVLLGFLAAYLILSGPSVKRLEKL